MSISTDMKKTADSIVGAYDTRISALGSLVSGVHETLNDFATDRKRSGKEQAAALSGFANGMVRGVARMLHAFQTDHDAMATELSTNLRQFDAGIEKEVSGLLRGFTQNHDRMSKKLHTDLDDYSSAIARETRRLLGGFRREQGAVASDLKATHAAWRDLSKTMAARRRGSIKTSVEVPRRARPRRKAK